MARVIANGRQDFESIISNNNFYVDKTNFIQEWWETNDEVTLITRPRRFGKTLTISMLECFFSLKYKGRGNLFENLNIWKNKKYQELQGTYPVIRLSFAGLGCNGYAETIGAIYQTLSDLYSEYELLKDESILSKRDFDYFDQVNENMSQATAVASIRNLCRYMYRYAGKKVIILLDEYDMLLQEAYLNGYWDELVSFMQKLFNATFKSNPYLDRAVMTGITRISKESMFSDLNNLTVITTTSNLYEDSFGFTQEEVLLALQEYGLLEMEDAVRNWYDGFTFGDRMDIYNPWSILNFLKFKKIAAYWVNTSSNGLVNQLIRSGDEVVKVAMEDLLKDVTLHTIIDEQIVFNQLDFDPDAIWSLLLAGGYLKVKKCWWNPQTGKAEYDLAITNKEVKMMFEDMIRGWFKLYRGVYNGFVNAMLSDNVPKMNEYMNDVALKTFSFFDTGKKPSKKTEPERFYHGFVLGLMVDLVERYEMTSNRQSGLGRYDVMIKSKDEKDAIILEFKVYDPKDEKDLEETVKSALRQIEEKQYAAALIAEGIPGNRIFRYGFAFKGQEVVIDGGNQQRVGKILDGKIEGREMV